MRRMILFLVIFFGVCCANMERPGEVPPALSSIPTPWLCSVEVTSLFELPEDGKLVKPSTLYVFPSGAKMAVARGTGTVIARDGNVLTILTAKHVVFGARNFIVEYDGTAAKGYDVKHNPMNDVSIFHVVSAPLAAKIMVAPLALSVPPVGTELHLVGNALGRGLRIMRSGPMASDKQQVALKIKVWCGSYHSYPGCSGGGIWANDKLVGVVSMVAIYRGSVASDMGLFVGVEDVFPLLQK